MVLRDQKKTEDRDITHENKETLKESTTKKFGTKRHINFGRKQLDTNPPLIHTLLAHGKILNHSTDWFPFRNFMVPRNKKLSTEDRDITHEVRETLKDSTRKNFGTKRHINFRRKKLDTLPHPLIHELFR